MMINAPDARPIRSLAIAPGGKVFVYLAVFVALLPFDVRREVSFES
jgi:hypothetical protein